MSAIASRILPVFAFAALIACSSGSDSTTGPTDQPDPGTPPSTPEPPPAAAPAPTIAYIRGGEIRGIEPDGRGDRSLWTVPSPGLGYTVSSLAWRPDGSEL